MNALVARRRLGFCLVFFGAGLTFGGGCSDERAPDDRVAATPPADVEPDAPPPASVAPSATSPDGAPPRPDCEPKPSPPPAVTPDVTVTVRADRGPHGAATPVKSAHGITGMSIADWRPEDYYPTQDPAFVALLSAISPGVLRWPAGHRSQEYNWARGGGGQWGDWTLEPARLEAFLALAKKVGAEPLLAINTKRGTPAAAADLVRYVNVERKHGVRYFQIGNEPDLTDDLTAGPEVYADQVVAFVDAMRAVDPDLRAVGPELLTGAHIGGLHGRRDWLTPVLQRARGRLAALSWHYYPLDSGQRNPQSSAIVSFENLFQEEAPDWDPAAISFADRIMPSFAAIRDAHAPGAELWVTEFAEDPGPAFGAGLSDVLAGALWTGDALGRYAEHGPGAVLRWVFKSPGQAFGILDDQNNPRPPYGATWLYARHFGDRFVATETTALTEVAARAALREDGALTVMLVNKTDAPKRVHVAVHAFCAEHAEQHTLDGDAMGSTAYTINGQTLSAATVQAGIAAEPIGDEARFDVELPPTSLRVIAYRP